MPMRSIVLATRNPGKVEEIRQVLASLQVCVDGLEAFGELPEVEEVGETFADNARDKAMAYAQATGQWCLADDSGLVVDALDGAPGVHSARFAESDCPPDASRPEIDDANNAKLLKHLKGVPASQRTARFVCHLAMADGRQVLLEADGAVEGLIATSPAGQNGFGYDPLFAPRQANCTMAELSAQHKNRISHRGLAVRRFVEQLKRFLREHSDLS